MNAGWHMAAMTKSTTTSGRGLINLFEEASLDDVELLAREAVQNAKDAGSYLREQVLQGTIPNPGSMLPEFRMRFAHRKFSAEQVSTLWDPLGLSVLRDFLTQSLTNKQNNSRIPTPGMLDKDGFSILTIDDFGCIGLGGDINYPGNSNWYRALLSIGFTGDKPRNSGGTRGNGKAAIVASSQVFTIFAYSRFPRVDGYEATRHFGGVTYTFNHTGIDGIDLSGRGTFGIMSSLEEGILEPLTDEEADSYARALGLVDRSSDEWSSFGTSLVVVCPSVELGDLLEQVEMNWWPAIIDGQLPITFEELDSGLVKSPDLAGRPLLTPFIRSFEIANNRDAAVPPYEFSPVWEKKDRSALNEALGVSGLSNSYSLGKVGYFIDAEKAFLDDGDQEEEDNSSTTSEVALIRSNGMVINYEKFTSRSVPKVHGVFIASSECEAMVQQVEPPAHSRWFGVTKGMKNEVVKTLKGMENHLKGDIYTMKRKVRPPENQQRKRLEVLARAFGELFKNPDDGPPTPPKPTPQAVHIHWLKAAEIEAGSQDSDLIQYRSRIRVRMDSLPGQDNAEILAEESNSAQVRINIQARPLEDESAHGEPLLSTWIGPTHGLREIQHGYLEGWITKDEWFEFESLTEEVKVKVEVKASVTDITNSIDGEPDDQI
jgi:hypothetical protein